MELNFQKYTGLGNDFIIIRENEIPKSFTDYSFLAKEVCERNFGIGADGLLIVRENPLEMIIINSDGSIAPMCGNGIRCFANYLYDNGIETKDEYQVKTGAGKQSVKIMQKEEFFITEVNMGKPKFFKDDAYFLNFCENEDDDPDEEEASPGSRIFLGTDHLVFYLKDDLDYIKYPQIKDPLLLAAEDISNNINDFPDKINVNLAIFRDKNTIDAFTFERGAGETYACGTGAASCVAVGINEGFLDDIVRCFLPGGELIVKRNDKKEYLMAGSSTRIASGVYYFDEENDYELEGGF